MIKTKFRILVTTGEGQRRGTQGISTVSYFWVLLFQKTKQKDLKKCGKTL